MPSRRITIAIVIFWLGMLGWLTHAEVWPRIQPGQPPSFTIDLMDDSQAMPVPTRWKATHFYGDGESAEYSISSFVGHDSTDDSFELSCRLEPRRSGEHKDQLLKLKKLETLYKLRRDGTVVRLSRMTATLTYLGPFSEAGRVTGFAAEVDENLCRFWRRDEKDAPTGEPVAVEVSWNGAVLMPLHPLQRMEGLRPDQRWGMYLFDPLASGATSEPHLSWVNARVRPRTETVRAQSRDRDCLVVDYQGAGGVIACSTWVDAEDGRVLRMTVRLGDSDSWEMTREGT